MTPLSYFLPHCSMTVLDLTHLHELVGSKQTRSVAAEREAGQKATLTPAGRPVTRA